MENLVLGASMGTFLFLALGAISSTRVRDLQEEGPVAFVHRFGKICHCLAKSVVP